MSNSALQSATFQALATQVGGHAGVQSSEDGSLLIKPALPLELDFYEKLGGAGPESTAFVKLRKYLPKFFGTLKLEGEIQPSKEGDQVGLKEAGDKKESLVLENLSHSFAKPNIMDIKLGTVLYDEGASPEKRERMIKTAAETTSFESGIRLTGFQVYSNATFEAVNTPKSYGKSIKVSDLPEGVRRFFPVASSPDGQQKGDQGSGLPPKLLLPILESIYKQISELLEAFSSIEVRMVGGSILVIYEADWEVASKGVQALVKGEFDKPEEVDEDDDDDETEAENVVTPPVLVKMIDFAHTRLVPGQGPDEGVIKGINTVLTLLKGRIEEVKSAF